MGELQGVKLLDPMMQAFVQSVRLYLRDHPQLNRLVAGEESSDRIIAWAVLDALSYFNGTPHFTRFTLYDLISKNQQHLMLRLTAISLLESIGLLQTRNHLNYSNGGINTGVNDKTPMIMNWLQYFKASTDQMVARVKVAINIEGILGSNNVGIHSELCSVNASYMSY